MGHKWDGNGAGLGFSPLGSRVLATVGDCGGCPIPGGAWIYPGCPRSCLCWSLPPARQAVGQEGLGPSWGHSVMGGGWRPRSPSCWGG